MITLFEPEVLRETMIMVPSGPPHPRKESSYLWEAEGKKEDKEEKECFMWNLSISQLWRSETFFFLQEPTYGDYFFLGRITEVSHWKGKM